MENSLFAMPGVTILLDATYLNPSIQWTSSAYMLLIIKTNLSNLVTNTLVAGHQGSTQTNDGNTQVLVLLLYTTGLSLLFIHVISMCV